MEFSLVVMEAFMKVVFMTISDMEKDCKFIGIYFTFHCQFSQFLVKKFPPESANNGFGTDFRS